MLVLAAYMIPHSTNLSNETLCRGSLVHYDGRIGGSNWNVMGYFQPNVSYRHIYSGLLWVSRACQCGNQYSQHIVCTFGIIRKHLQRCINTTV